MSDVKTGCHFWAKTTADGQPGISVLDHMLVVGHVALLLVEISPELLQHWNLSPRMIAALAALHDLGKISPGFQQKCPAWLKLCGLAQVAQRNAWATSQEKDHGKTSQAAIQSALIAFGMKRSTVKYLATALGAHHGFLREPRDNPQIQVEAVSGIAWEKERFDAAQKIWDHFGATGHWSAPSDHPALWWLAGLTSVADWVGSNERFFPPDAAPPNLAHAARRALDDIGFARPSILPDLSFESVFGFPPNALQHSAERAISKPGVYVIEAPMGMGKTEAALWVAYLLLSRGFGTGLYFALPTQATSNRMYLRINAFLRCIMGKDTRARLAHGNSWLMETETSFVLSGSTQDTTGRDWFASAKRALLAPFGVGTVDQCLLGVVAAKHFFVRQFALAGKIVILDEIHSYDCYTGTLIEKLITVLEGLGCTVIILSATLTAKRRQQLLGTDEFCPEKQDAYPLISGKGSEDAPPVPAPTSRSVQVKFSSEADALDQAIHVARQGGSVLWICNTVGKAQQCYQNIVARCDGDIPLGLLHSRFPFFQREKLEAEWLERFGKNSAQRCGSILVGSQVWG